MPIPEKEKYLKDETNAPELFHDERWKPVIHKNIEGPKILKSEGKSPLVKLNRNKAATVVYVVSLNITPTSRIGLTINKGVKGLKLLKF